MINLPDSYKHKKVAVFGLGISGVSTIKALQRSQSLIFAWDDNESCRNRVKSSFDKESESQSCHFISPNDYNWTEILALVVSPGIPTSFPSPHWVVKLAQNNHCPIKSDIELFLEGIQQHEQDSGNTSMKPKIIAVTGTNGKSTTTALIGYILNYIGIPCAIGGNIGFPVLDLKNGCKAYILELSSFQIDLLSSSIISSAIDISILLNLTPDHIDRHGSFENYIKSKEKLLKNTKDLSIICVDSIETLQVYERLCSTSKSTSSLMIHPVSTKEFQTHGTSILNGEIFYTDADNRCGSLILDISKLKINLGTNSQNIASAVAAVLSISTSTSDLLKITKNDLSILSKVGEAIESFPGLPHRAEHLGTIKNISFINDSKSTNADSSQKTLLSFEEIYWILGGKPKEGGISSLLTNWETSLAKIKKIFLIGQATEEFTNSLITFSCSIECFKCETLENAFKVAVNEAEAEELRNKEVTILLSPACASFDQWKNFEERGDAFRKLVHTYILERKPC